VGLEVAVTLEGDAVAELALDNLIVLTDSLGAEVEQVFSVWTHPFVGPVRAADVRRWMNTHWRGEPVSESWARRVATLANNRLRARLLELDDYLSTYWDPTTLEPIGHLMMKDVLWDVEGFGHPKMDLETYKRGIALDLNERIGRLQRGAAPKDRNRDGVITPDEQGAFPTLTMVR